MSDSTRLASPWAALALALFLVGCETGPAFSVPPGPPKVVSVEVTLPVATFGAFAIGSFVDALCSELAKYAIEMVPSGSHRPVAAAFRIDVGEITYRQWQTIDVSFLVEGAATLVGQVHVTDLSWVTLEAAALPVGALIARRVWGVGATATATPPPPRPDQSQVGDDPLAHAQVAAGGLTCPPAGP